MIQKRPTFSSAILALILAICVHATNGNEEEKSNPLNDAKGVIVKSIVAKVTNMTLNTLSKTDPDQKFQILDKIRQRVVNASKFLGENGRKYVDIIMEGVHATAFGEPDLPKIRTTKSRKALTIDNHVEVDASTKSKLVRSIAKKIEQLTKEAFYNAKTNEEKQEILKNIMKRVVHAANKHKIMARSKDEVKPYGDLVVEGVGLVLQQKSGDAIERRKINLLANSNDGTISDEDDLQPKTNDVELVENMVKRETLPEEQGQTTITDNTQLFTGNVDLCGCSCIVNKTCTKVHALSTFYCRRDNNIIELEKMCDGAFDCSDKSDEENCSQNVLKSLRSASRVINDIEKLLPRGCLKTTLEDNVLTTQNMVLRNVLQRQLEFLDKYDPVKDNLNISKAQDKISIFNQVNLVVSTVGFALQAAFCVQEQDSIFSRRNGELMEENNGDMLQERSWAAPRCVCDDEACANANCSSTCERTCWQRYSLSRWTCPAVNYDFVVSLDEICDGKIDCYDETDERECNTGSSSDKFEASDRFNMILKLISSKISLEEYHPVLNKLNALQESIKVLQKHSSKIKPDLPTVKGLRDKCFADLISIYDDIVQRADILEKVEEGYLFLGAVSEKLVGALKHTSLGNERTIVNDSCLCRGEFCSTPLCSNTCIRACSIKAKIIKYPCKGDKNVTIEVDKICNGVANCPEGDDEEDCQKEICRNHHLVVLRNKLQNLKDFHKGIAIGETLRAWKTKAIADLVVAEKRSRVTRGGLRKTVSQILHDLTMSYATLGSFRRSRDKIEQSVDRFLELARLVQSTMRTCTK